MVQDGAARSLVGGQRVDGSTRSFNLRRALITCHSFSRPLIQWYGSGPGMEVRDGVAASACTTGNLITETSAGNMSRKSDETQHGPRSSWALEPLRHRSPGLAGSLRRYACLERILSLPSSPGLSTRSFFSLATSSRPQLGFENGWKTVGAELENCSENCGSLHLFRPSLNFPFRRIRSFQNHPWSRELSPRP